MRLILLADISHMGAPRLPAMFAIHMGNRWAMHDRTASPISHIDKHRTASDIGQLFIPRVVAIQLGQLSERYMSEL